MGKKRYKVKSKTPKETISEKGQRRMFRNQLCDELKNTPSYKKYIDSALLEDVSKQHHFYRQFQRPDKNLRRLDEQGWIDLFVTEHDHWRVQRYKDTNYCRIRDWDNKGIAHGDVEQIICPILNECHRQAHLEKLPQKDWGIVFCGGGGKGAYQIGVWKWLIAHGISEKITGVSGASVGALNSLLFILGDPEKAHKIWHNIKNDDIVDTKSFILLQSSRPIRDIIDRNIDNWDKICNTPKVVYSSLTGTNTLPAKAVFQHIKNGVAHTQNAIRAEYFCWASRSAEEIKQVVLASAAIPAIKKPRHIEKISFVDGGLADNVPVKPLVEDGFLNIIVIHLGQNDTPFKKAIAGLDIENIKFHHVYPSLPLGDMKKANPDLTEKRIAQGYGDADLQLKYLLSDPILMK